MALDLTAESEPAALLLLARHDSPVGQLRAHDFSWRFSDHFRRNAPTHR
jgi:hypothetical protein